MQKSLLGMMLLLFSLKGNACEVCGNASAGSQLGILPQFQKHFIGIQYQYSGFDSKSHHDPNKIKSYSKEQFHTTQVWGRLIVHQRLHLYGFLPYKANYRQTEIVRSNLKGVGDAMLMANFMVLNQTLQNQKTFKHVLQLGLGIKLPSGKSDAILEGLMLHPNIQTGSGSFDIPMNLIYTLRYKSMGAQAEINYTQNNYNRQHFKFGNRYLSTLRCFAWKNINKFSLLPNIGATYESAAMDIQNKTVREYTGGDCVSGNFGLDIYYKQFALNLLFQKYVYQNIGDGLISNHPRIMANLLYLFKQQKK